MLAARFRIAAFHARHRARPALAAGDRPIDFPPHTVCDGLRGTLGAPNFALLQGAAQVITVADEAPVAQEIAFHAADDPLSDREIDILALVAAGAANKDVAWKLSISEETVKAHMKSIFAKLDVGDRTHAVTAALKRGIMTL